MAEIDNFNNLYKDIFMLFIHMIFFLKKKACHAKDISNEKVYFLNFHSYRVLLY